MKPRRVVAGLVAALLAGCHPKAPPGVAPPLVVISVDGLRPVEVLDADALGLKIPELRRMRREGTVARVQGVLPTVTYPSHTTLVTGVRPRTHGIHANTFFDPFGRNGGGWQWYAEDVGIPTLWQAAEEAGLSTASLYWPVNVGGRARWSIAEVWHDTTDDRKLTRALSTPGLVAGLERELGELPPGHQWDIAGDRARARFAARVLETKRPRFATVHLLALDHEQHGRGPGTAEVHATLEQLDEIVASLRHAADGSERANVCVVSDHGFAAIHTRISVARAFADAKLLEHDGPALRSFRAMTWSTGGTAAVMLQDRDPATADATRAVLDSLAARPELGIDRILGRADIDALGGFPEAAFVVAMKPGFVVDDAIEGPIVSPLPEWARGAHGYLPTEPAMQATFLCAGPSVPAGRDLGNISMLDVAPTFATLLHIALPTAEGKSAL